MRLKSKMRLIRIRLLALLVFISSAGDLIGPSSLSVAKTVQRQAGGMTLPPDLWADSAPERFSPETLFDIINGDADLYLKAGFVALESQRILLDNDSRQSMDFFAYQMNGHRSAFAVFSVRRGREAVPDSLTSFAYRYRNGFFFVHGPFYVEIIAAEETNLLVDAAHRLAAAFIEANPVEVLPIPELDRFPSENRIPGSVVLYPAGGFGFEAFDNLFTARYQVKGGEATAFFRPCGSLEEAARLSAAYQDFLLEYEGVRIPLDDVLPNSRLLRVAGRYTLVFTQGRTVAGVQDAASPEQATMLARRLSAALSSGPN
jgi:hypothetical protein